MVSFHYSYIMEFLDFNMKKMMLNLIFVKRQKLLFRVESWSVNETMNFE